VRSPTPLKLGQKVGLKIKAGTTSKVFPAKTR
jgi:hypothetical protein